MASTRNHGRKRPATLADVADLAGVSKSTVSNVVRGHSVVSDQTRETVLRAIERLGYRPNAIARQFVQQRTTTLGILVGGLDNPWYAELAQRVERSAFSAGYTPMLCNIEEDDERAALGVETLLEQRVAGVAFLSFFGRTPRIRDALEGQVPVVFIGLREDWGDSVTVDDAGGAALAIKHLVDLGHERIAYVSTPYVEERTDEARYDGYCAALKSAGLDFLERVLWNPDDVADPRHAAVLRAPTRPTAFFASNDIGAIDVMDAADREDIPIPDDISLVGFDDVSLARLRRISLTTVVQPVADLVEIGMQTLRARIEQGDQGPPKHTSLAASLAVRESTGPPVERPEG